MARTPLLVWITAPEWMDPGQLCHEVRVSIGFGEPEVRPLPLPGMLAWHSGKHRWEAHDGYPRHQHSANGMLTIGPGDTRVHFKGGLPF